MEAPIGTVITVEECTIEPPEGMEFSHWSTERNGMGVTYLPGQTFVLYDDVTLYAQWRDKA